ncbi:hypothetical protein [Mycolicibacterium agri]|nr:hypothetical protein [Mycolicibacterium agri]
MTTTTIDLSTKPSRLAAVLRRIRQNGAIYSAFCAHLSVWA